MDVRRLPRDARIRVPVPTTTNEEKRIFWMKKEQEEPIIYPRLLQWI